MNEMELRTRIRDLWIIAVLLTVSQFIWIVFMFTAYIQVNTDIFGLVIFLGIPLALTLWAFIIVMWRISQGLSQWLFNRVIVKTENEVEQEND